MLYSRLGLLWLVHMLTQTATALCENNGTECLVLKPEDSHEICSEQMDWRKVGLRHCGRSLASILPGKPSPTRDCHENIKELYARDRQAHEFVTSFQQLLRRYDCSKPYSVKFKCPDCQKAYKEWVCSSLLSYWNNGRSIRPCRSFCHGVEQKCPFFLPLDKGPAHYAGEPTFLCLDPNIKETGEQLKNSLYGTSSCCYEKCEPGLCLRGTCLEEEEPPDEPTSEAFSSRGNFFPSSFTFLLALTSLLLFRTRLFI